MTRDRDTRRKAMLLNGLTEAEAEHALELADFIMDAGNASTRPLPDNVLPFKPRNPETKEKTL